MGLHLPMLPNANPPPGKGKNRPKIPPRIRAAVYKRDKYRCVYCGSTRDLTIDHKKALGNGGKNNMANMVTACEPCNAEKADGKAPPMLRKQKR